MTLHSNTSFRELTDYALLCHEHRIKKVKLDPETYNRVKELAFNTPKKSLKFMGITFNKA